MGTAERQRFEAEVRSSFGAIAELCADLIRTPSENPPGDTGRVAMLVERKLSAAPEIAVRRVVAKEPAVNLIANLSGARPGRRLVINGHLDTFPAGDRSRWTVDPFGGIVRDGRLYGRGAADMKAGLAAAVTTALLLARHRDAIAGELVLTLVGDEETGGRWGTQHLLAHEPDALGDAMISGTIEGGISVNLIPDRATARADIRFPPGLAVADVLAEIRRRLDGLPGVEVRLLSSSEPNWTDPAHEIVARTAANAAAYLGRVPACNMRLGFSDSRFYRYKAVPSIVYGPVAYGMGGPDEHVTIEDLQAVFYVHAMTTSDYRAERAPSHQP